MSLSQYTINWGTNLYHAAANCFSASSVQPDTFPIRTAIKNVNVWDGHQRISNTTIVIDGKIISLTGKTFGARVVDGKGGFLMPGFLDAHVHVSSKEGLERMAQNGVTTAFDMGSFPSSKMHQWYDVGKKGLTSLRFSGAAACVKPGFPSVLPGFPEESLITSEENATNFVDIRVNEGVDHLKLLINEHNEPKQEYQQIIKDKADAAGKLLITHAPFYEGTKIARAVGGKFTTHSPVDKALTKEDAKEMLKNGQVAIPTLLMMDYTIDGGQLLGQGWDYKFCNDTVAIMYEAGVPILAGTDAASLGGGTGPPGLVEYGPSFHEELVLLAGAGMSNEDVLRSATSLTASHFNLTDRGVIKPGARADLVLLSADPLEDISNTNKITQIWTAGTRVKGLFGAKDRR